jgi:hypothetical protein
MTDKEQMIEAVKQAMNSHDIIGLVSNDCFTSYRVMTGETQIGGDIDCYEDATTLCMNLNAQAAIAAVFQEIRAAVGREDVVDAGLLEYEGYYALDNKVLRDGMQHSMEAMLDQIERTQKP